MALSEQELLHASIRPKPPFIAPGHDPASVTEKISEIVLQRLPKWWYVGFGISFLIVLMFLNAIGNLFWNGIGIWGNNIPVGWGWDITNFVWWIGIGHAGTLISAVLLLLRQSWRTSINRFAEAMTIFAVACAGIYPVIHTGRPWLAYWLLPYPNTMGIWPNFRSPLVWDVFAVSTYATVSMMFWYIGLIPDLATLRDRSDNKIAKMIYGMLSMGWRGAPGTGRTTRPRTCSSPGSQHRWCSRCIRWFPSTSRPASCPAGTPRSSRRTSSRRVFAASRWC